MEEGRLSVWRRGRRASRRSGPCSMQNDGTQAWRLLRVVSSVPISRTLSPGRRGGKGDGTRPRTAGKAARRSQPVALAPRGEGRGEGPAVVIAENSRTFPVDHR